MRALKFKQMFIPFLVVVFFFETATATQSPSTEKTTQSYLAKIKFGESEIKSIFAQFQTVGSVLRVIEMTSTKEDYADIKKQVLATGLTEESVMPTYEVNGSWVKAPGSKKKFDFSRFAAGEIYDGNSKWRFDSSKSQSENMTRLMRYLQGDNKVSSLSKIFISEAHALSVGELGLQVAAPLALYAVTWQAALYVVGAIAESSAVAAAGVAVGGVALFLLAVETLWKAGARYGTGAEIRCNKGQLELFLPAKNNQVIPLPSKVMSTSNPTEGEVGWGELKFRQAFCNAPKSDREAFNKALQSAKPTDSTVGGTNSVAPVGGKQ